MRILPVVAIAACAASFAWLRSPTGLAAADGHLSASQAPITSTIFVDASVTDDNGRAVTTLRPQDLRVTVDGEPRTVVSLRYVHRGPGADAAALVSDATREAPAAAERARSLLLLIDESTIPPGQEKLVVGIAGRLLGELGSADQAGVAPLPTPPSRIALSTDAASRHASLLRVAGRAVAQSPADASPPAFRPADDRLDRTAGARGRDPDEQARVAEAEREAAERARRGQGAPGADPDAQRSAGARSTAGALLSIVEGVRNVPGLKTLIVLRQAESSSAAPVVSSPQERQADVANLLSTAARARAVIHLVVVGQAPRRPSAAEDDLRTVAAASGGTVSVARNAADSKAFDVMRAALSGGYLVEVEGRETDAAADRPRAVKMEIARGRMTLSAPQLWAPRKDPVPSVIAAAPKTMPVGAVASPSAGKPARKPRPDDPQLVVLLARLTEYVAAYVRDFGNVVAEEDYHQQLLRGTPGGALTRRLRSDLLLVKTDSELDWTQYRDVFEVDGKPVRDRAERVQALFLENPSGARRLAEQISNESARYNIGTLTRTTNLPMLPLAFLGPTRIAGLDFWRNGEETVNGIRAARVSFEEMARPTLVRPVNWPGDAPAAGTIWMDPSSGRILKTRISVTAGRTEMKATVVYRPVPETGLWVPSEMDENYSKPEEEIEGHAVYRNFRSFMVKTDMILKK